MSAIMEREKREIRRFLENAVFGEHQALLDGERESKSYANIIDNSELHFDSTGITLKLKTKRSFRIVIL